MTNDMRADVLLTQKALAPSRTKASELIKAGRVFADGLQVERPSMLLPEDAVISIHGEVCPYVSRGAYKLEKAVSEFKLNLKDADVLDVGASTGGFTDFALQNGAKHVYAVDVGSSQLHEKLRGDPRVTVLEQTDARNLDKAMFDDEPTLCVIDVSFISLFKLLPGLCALLQSSAPIVALIKPQFEAGRQALNKHGIVTDEKMHIRVLQEFLTRLPEYGRSMQGCTYSPIQGGSGNIEFLALFTSDALNIPDVKYIRNVVRSAHKNFKG